MMLPILWTPDGRPISAKDRRPPTDDLYSYTIRPYLSWLGEITPEYLQAAFQSANSGYFQTQADFISEMFERDGQTRRANERLKQDIATTPFKMLPNEEMSADRATKQDAVDMALWVHRQLDKRDVDMVSLVNGGMDYDAYGLALEGLQWANEASARETRIVAHRQVRHRDIQIDSQSGYIQTLKASSQEYRDLVPWGNVIFTNATNSNYPARQARGRQLAYWFILKLLALRAYSVYMERNSTPLLVAAHPPSWNAGDTNMVELEKVLVEAASNGWILIPDNVKLSPIEVGTGYSVFTEAIRQCDIQISDMILGQSFMTVEASYGTYDKGTDAEWVTYDIKEFHCMRIVRIIQDYLVKPYLLHNWGLEALNYAPTFKYLYEHEEDLERNANVVGVLIDKGFPASGKHIEEQYERIIKKWDPTDADDWLMAPAPTEPLIPMPGGDDDPGMETDADLDQQMADQATGEGKAMQTNLARDRAAQTLAVADRADDLLANLARLAARKGAGAKAALWFKGIKEALRPYAARNDIMGAMRALKLLADRLTNEPGAADPEFARMVRNCMLVMGAQASHDHRTRNDFRDYLRRSGRGR